MTKLARAVVPVCLLLLLAMVPANAATVPYGWGGLVPMPLAEEARDLVDVSGTGDYAVGIRADGRILGWGTNFGRTTSIPHDLRLVPPPGAPMPVRVAAGVMHVAVLFDDGTVRTWGTPGGAPITVPPELASPPAPGAPMAIRVAAGPEFTVVLMNDGSLRAWGLADSLEGVSAFASPPAPGAPMPIGIACSARTTAVLHDDGSVLGFGREASTAYLAAPPPGSPKAISVEGLANGAIDPAFVFRMDDETIRVQGRRTSPTLTTGITGVAEAVPTGWGILARKTDGSLIASGPAPAAGDAFGTGIPAVGLDGCGASPVVRYADGSMRHLGTLGGRLSGSVPLHVQGKDIVDMAIGGDSTIALDSDGKLHFWDNDTARTVPPAETGTRFRDIAVGDRSFTGRVSAAFLGVREDGTVAVWGDDYGELISGRPSGLTNVKSVATGHQFAVALRHDGTVAAWGANSATYGIAAGAITLSNVTAIAAGAYSAIALHGDGSMTAWGDDTSGSAAAPPGLTGVVAVAAGQYDAFALKSDGTVVAWGLRTGPGGILAVPTNLAVPAPPGGPRAVGITAGIKHAVVCFDNGIVQTWGEDAFGSLETPTGIGPVRAVYAGRYSTVALVEAATSVSVADASCLESGGPLVFPIRLSHPADGATTVDYSLATGSATHPADFNPVSLTGTVNIPDGASSAAVSVPLVDDFTAESDETFTLTLSNPSPNALLGDATATGTIRNDDSDLPVLSVESLRVDEESGAGQITVRMDRTAATGVSVQFILNSGSAIEGDDWSATAAYGTLTIPSGERVATIPFAALGDSLAEPDEAFSAQIHSSVNASIAVGGNSAQVRITDDDSILPRVSVADVSVAESPGNAIVTVNLDRAAAGDLTVFYRTRGGTALPGRDYLTRTATLFFPEGETSGTLAIQLLDNSVAGRDLTFEVEILAVIGPAEPGDASATVTILDDDRQAMPPWGGIPVIWGDGAPGSGSPVVPFPPPLLTRISAGPNFFIGLRQDGTVTGWGNGMWPSGPPIPPGVTDGVAVAAGWSHSLVLKSDGTVAGGDAPPGLGGVVAISAGRFHSLALTADGRVVAWGTNTHGQCDVPDGLPPVAGISAGELHSMALTRTGQVFAWGSDLENESTVPVGIGPCTAISAGNLRSVAIGVNGQVHYWGRNFAYTEVEPPYDAPALPGVPLVVDASLGQDHIIGVLDNGAVVTWGNVAPDHLEVPPFLPQPFQVAAGAGYSVALVEGVPPPAITVHDVELAEGLTLALGRVTIETAAATDIFVTLAAEARTATEVADYDPTGFGMVRIPAGETVGYYGLEPVEDALVEADEYFRVRLVSVPPGYRAGPSAKITILDNDSIRKPFAWGAGAHLPMTESVGTSVAMAAGSSHTLALRGDGRVQAWGSNAQGQGNVPVEIRPGGPTSATAIAAGDTHSLALTADGRVLCWGNNQSGQVGAPSSLGTPPAAPAVAPIAVSAGQYHSLALLQNGTVLAWGAEMNFFGGGPFAAYGQADVPPGLSNVLAIAAGGLHSLALDSSHVVHQWGSDGFGDMLVPTELASPPAPGARHAVALAAGSYHSLALMSDGSVITWGLGAGGPAALPTALATAPPVGLRAIAIAAGQGHSLALLQNGTILAWGDNDSGQTTVPGGIPTASAIAAGARHSMAITASGPRFWGGNIDGQGEIPPVLPLLRSIGKPNTHALAITPGRLPVTWGDNYGDFATPPPGLDNLRRVTTGTSHSLAVRADGEVIGWGNNAFGQATPPPLLRPAREVAAASAHSLAACADGTIAAWGIGFSGETTPPDYVFDAIDVAAGFGFSVALLDSGHVLAWGDPWSGATTVPADLADATAIACGDYHVLALRADGTVRAWGNNDNGQCDVPPGLAGVVAIAAGQFHSIALTATGNLVAWGSNEFGESTVPVLSGPVCDLKAGFHQNLLLLAEPSGGAGAHMLRWASDSGLDPALFDPLGDLGGLNGLLRFAFNIDAFDFSFTSISGPAATSGTPNIRFVPSPGGGGTLIINYLRRGDTDLSYFPEVSSTLAPASWLPAEGPTSVTPLDDIMEQITIEHPVPPGTSSLFGRVRVSSPP